jgi:hypothetical protein
MAMMRNNNDENAIVHPNKSLTTGSKTPAATKTPTAAGTKKTRRAFGDIRIERGRRGTGQQVHRPRQTPAMP